MRVLSTLLAALWLGLAPSSAWAQLFRRPVACDACIAGWYYYDHDGSGGWQDWSCRDSSYDGHRGNDFSLSGGNGAIDTGYDIVAAADGTVVAAEDGYYDHCTACGGEGCGTAYAYGFGNHVVINHGAYRVAYCHMRTGSVRVGVGDTVTCGQVIGQIGSSGCSTGAHLHFEVRPLDGDYTTAFDPFEGGCSPTSPSLWVDQGAHRGLPSAECDGPPIPTCPDGTTEIWTCIDGGAARRRCIDGVDEIEDCLFGCVSSVAGVDDQCAATSDGDGDGYGSDVDCDDDDITRHPDATEVCSDGIDQNCDGIDLECPPVPPDADDDGYTQDIDCDDADPDAYPGAPEVCGDRVDQDCDGFDVNCRDGDIPPDPDSGVVTDGGVIDPTTALQGHCACRAARSARGDLSVLAAMFRILIR